VGVVAPDSVVVMNPTQIDEAILASADHRFLKVARIIVAAANKLALPDSPERYNVVAERLYRLVEEGCLVGIGDMTRWRDSEVRLPGKH
jgi:hypothetical protein